MGEVKNHLPSGTVAFLLTDIEGSTALLRELDAEYDVILGEHREIVRAAIAQHGGVEVRTEGDSFLVAFAEPSDGLRCAQVAQRSLSQHDWPGSGLRVRMGLHVGIARVVDADYVSLALHEAARIVTTAHGGQIVLSEAAARAVEGNLPEFTELLSLGPYRVRDFDEPVELFQLVGLDLPRTFPPPRAPSARVHNLPSQRTSFVGRHDDVLLVAKLVDRDRVVTVVGPGGVGKTRLASQVGYDVAGKFDGGVWFVALAGVENQALVVDAVGAALQCSANPGESRLDAICRRLSVGRNLVFLDNCEHLADACAELAEAMLERCPSLHVLLTSREPLRLPDEQIFEVETMRVPPEGAPWGEIASSETVKLFVERARQSDHSFELTESNAADAAAVCRALDGLPLALELAAARMFEMTLSELAARVADSSPLLTVTRRGGDSRHRTIQATIDWTRERLAPHQQALFARLSVFRGGFTVEAAHAVVGDGLAENLTTSSLDVLVRVSLVDRQPESDPPRLRMLEPVRQYAASLLSDDEQTSLAELHAEWFAELAGEAARQQIGSGLSVSLSRLDDERDNLHFAIATALARGSSAVAVGLIESLSFYWETRGALAEAIAFSTQALALSLTVDERARVLLKIGGFKVGLRDTSGADIALSEAETLFSMSGNDYATTESLRLLAFSGALAGEYDRAAEMYSLAAEKFRRIGATGRMAFCLAGLAELETWRSDPGRSVRYVDEAMSAYRSLSDLNGNALCHLLLGRAEVVRGRLDAAEAAFARARQVYSELGYLNGVGNSLQGLAEVAFVRGDRVTARELLIEGLDTCRRAQSVEGQAECLCALAWLETFDGTPESAGEILTRSFDTFTGPLLAPQQRLVAVRLDRLQGEPGRAAAGLQQLVEAASAGGPSPNVSRLALEDGLTSAAVGDTARSRGVLEELVANDDLNGGLLAPDERAEAVAALGLLRLQS